MSARTGWRDGTLTFPSASRAASKKSIMPKNMKSVPNVVSATPISVGGKRSVEQACEWARQDTDSVHQRATLCKFFDGGRRVSNRELVVHVRVGAWVCRVQVDTSLPRSNSTLSPYKHG